MCADLVHVTLAPLSPVVHLLVPLLHLLLEHLLGGHTAAAARI